MELVENIEKYCKTNEITAQAFERKCGIPHGSVRKWKTGVYKSQSTKSLNRIAEATGIPTWRWMAKGGI